MNTYTSVATRQKAEGRGQKGIISDYPFLDITNSQFSNDKQQMTNNQ
ncbi:MAG: hypothetical protein F6J92_32880 [Symploca sp. SIO1A3]|nr:hypothetical protein [Symploca sp. SIO1A3]